MSEASAGLGEWIGRTRIERDRLSLFPVRGMAALLDSDPTLLENGSRLPAGWHWLYFKPTTRRSDLGADGHPRRGGFLPPVELPRRMWAGGRFRFGERLCLGEDVERVSSIRDVSQKQGRSGPLVFVIVNHRVSGPAGLACDEDQDIVYRGAPGPHDPVPAPHTLGEPVAWSEDFTPDRLALFRFSALTFNSHRIHYDPAYAQAEGYPDLVVHAPLIALLLLGAAQRNADGRVPASFEYRAVSPLFVEQPIRLQGEPVREEHMRLWATGAGGRIAMTATAAW
jgi:3-methylfumaryl-CoA hydratase